MMNAATQSRIDPPCTFHTIRTAHDASEAARFVLYVETGLVVERDGHILGHIGVNLTPFYSLPAARALFRGWE
jgi:hypothetical protein